MKADPRRAVGVLVLLARIEDAANVVLGAAPQDPTQRNRLRRPWRPALPVVALGRANHLHSVAAPGQPQHERGLALVFPLEADDARAQLLLEPSLSIFRRHQIDATLDARDHERAAIATGQVLWPLPGQLE